MVEIETFTMRHDADDAAFDAANTVLQTGFFYAQPGLERRTTLRSNDGTWTVITTWDTVDYADPARSKFDAHQAAMP